ncbi:CCA tRNA nucleotidyltransferase, mitochondrial, variant 2 [Balamuthia mandrillaris]
MTGIEFCEYVVKYQEQRGIKASRVGLIKANPEQSKHLETAVMSIFGHPIEFVNLRVEEYNPDCRIPQMKLGNEKEDVKRRDFTINALFYNIHDDNVEDWTGMGLDDLQNKVLRTPIAPLDTMLEDPLRVLRAIRFAASFDLSLDPALDSALSDPNVKKALSSKVSRERFGIELNKMWSLNKQKTMQALEHIFRLNLHDVVWLVDDSSFSSTSSSSLQPSLWSSRMKDWSLRMTRGMHKLLSEDERIQKKQTGLQPIYHWTFKEKTQHDLAYLTAVLSPFLFTASLVETPPSKKRVKRMQQNIMNILRSSLSLSNAQIGSVIGIVDATYKLLPIIAQERLEQAFVDDRADALVDNIHNQVPLDHSYFKQKHQQHQLDEVKSQFQEQQQRKAYATFVQNNTGELGMWLRECSLHPSNSQLCWLVSAYLADLVINLLTPLQQTEGELKDEIDGRVGTRIPFQAPLLIEAIVQSSLVSVLQMDPFLNGEDIMKELNIAAGPAVGEFTSRLVQWQITQGTNATKEQAITYLQFLHRKRQE